MSLISRRRFLIGSTTLLAAPLWPKPGLSADPDVVVIGAGAAGLAAARRLLQAGHSVTVIEADTRIGGRALTDRSIFGVPYDVGAHWLHNAGVNPFVRFGQENGFTLYQAPDEHVLYVGDRKATIEDARAFRAAHDDAVDAISRAGEAGRDVSPASVVPDNGPWRDLVHLAVGPYEMAKDFDHFSCLDWWNSADGADWFCKEGFGALWAHGARDIPVQLSTKADIVRWGGSGVRVETDRGTIAAKVCIVTVSTGVLANQALTFDPPLSAQKQASFHGITMGLYNHIALQFRENVFGLGDDGLLLYKPEPAGLASPRAMGVLANVAGTNLTFGDVGGEFARDLEKDGQAAAIDFGLSELRRIFGASIDRAFIKGHATNWGRNPLTYGAYASAEPGAYGLRETLREPVGDRIWFAGEACSEDEWATLAGAHKNGIATAERVAAFLGA